jgi:hypothetical protein
MKRTRSTGLFASAVNTPVVSSVEMLNGKRLVIVRGDVFQTAMQAAKTSLRKEAKTRTAQRERNRLAPASA